MIVIKYKPVASWWKEEYAPKKSTSHSVGFDLYARLEEKHPNGAWVFDTGLIFEIPEGYEMEIRPRSGLFLRYGMIVHNGTIDPDHREDSVKILALNIPPEWKKGEVYRVAQALFRRVPEVSLERSDKIHLLGEHQGFGSTGIE